MKQVVILYNDFTETRHNVQGLTLDEVLYSFLSLGSAVIAITVYSTL